ncbi:MAG: SDR family oxidoreductase [Candidatus Acidiferrales bacterium]
MTTRIAQAKLQTVLVTGGTDGLGLATAQLLASRGYRVFAGGRNAERRAALDAWARDRAATLAALEMDVCDDASVDSAVSEIERRAGPVGILVNNAGIAFGAVLEEMSQQDLHRLMETNFFGAIRVAQRVLPAMRRLGRGRIVNLSSIAGKAVLPLLGAYSASKFALEAASDALRLELYPFGIHVALIEPGYIPTSINRNAAELSSSYAKNAERSAYRGVYEQFQKQWGQTTKTSRYTPGDCAEVILRAIEDERPRARYLVTREAKIASLMKWLLPDGAWDRGLIKRLRLDVVKESVAAEAVRSNRS